MAINPPPSSSLPLPLPFYLPLPSRPSIVSSHYLPTNFAFKVSRDIPLFSSSNLVEPSSTIWICPSEDRDRRCNTLPPSPRSNASKDAYRGFVATNRVSGLMASRRGATMPAPPGNIGLRFDSWTTRNPSCYTPRGSSNVDPRACIHRCTIGERGFKAILIVGWEGRGGSPILGENRELPLILFVSTRVVRSFDFLAPGM